MASTIGQGFDKYLGTRQSSINPTVTEYYRKDNNQGFETPQKLFDYTNTLNLGKVANFDDLSKGVSTDTLSTPALKIPEQPKADPFAPLSAATVSANEQQASQQANTLQTQQQDLIKQLTEALNNQPSQSETVDQALTKYKVPELVQQLQDLNTQIATTQGNYSIQNQKIENAGIDRGVPTAYYQGDQAQLNKMRLIETGALAARQAALSDNLTLAKDLAQKTVDAQFSDQQAKIDRLKTFISLNDAQLTKAEQKRTEALNKLADIQQEQINTQKEERKWAIEKGINSQFYTRGGTVYRASDGYAFRTPEEAFAAGVAKDFSNSPVYSDAKSNFQIVGEDVNGNNVYGFVDTANQIVKPFSGGGFGGTTGGAPNLGPQTGTIKGIPAYNMRETNPGINFATRNNNPGNIKVFNGAQEFFEGVIGVDSIPAQDSGNFLIFATPEAGLAAMEKNLLNSKYYKGVTAEQAIKKWNGNGGYGAKDVGLEPNKDFQAQIQDPVKRRQVVELIAKAEGWKPNINTASNQYFGLDPKVYNAGVQVANDFRQEQIVKDYNNVLNKKQSVDQIVDAGVGGPGDLALVYEFMKALDPTSVVRETEYDSAAKSGNLFLGALARFNGFFKEDGGMLPDNVKQAFKDIIRVKFDVAANQYNNVYNEYARRIDGAVGKPEYGQKFLTNYSKATGNTFVDELGILPILESMPAGDPLGLGLEGISGPQESFIPVVSSANQGSVSVAPSSNNFQLQGSVIK